MTWIKLQFHDGDIVELNFPTYVIDMWIEEKKPIAMLRRIATVLDFKEYLK
jgi:hypothetical protein|tara:strand:+ start:630 stop:782 length:153 start_codon:yes stop_codon:yes gene_type:complete